MAAIVAVGLGPGGRGQVTVETEALIERAARDGRLVLRTRIHPVVDGWAALGAVHAMDGHYEAAPSFDETYARIAAEVVERAIQMYGDEPLVYAVPGHPLVGESTVLRVRALAAERGVGFSVLPGLSFVDAVLAAVGEDGESLRVADALRLGRIDPTTPLLVCQVYSRAVAADVKLALAEHYPDDHEVALVHAAGVPGQERVERLRLLEIDRLKDVAHLTSLWVPPLAPLDALREPHTLRELMARLRAPEPDGCPWDRDQTHDTLRRYLLEETYEALDALDVGDYTALQEELGDLLLQIVFHAQIADEDGRFSLGDVCAGISNKLIRRHPHVFGAAQQPSTGEAGAQGVNGPGGGQDAQAVLRNWEQLKREERAEKDQADRSMLDGVPASMPALSYAQQVQDRAARVGFDWPDVQGVLEKVAEEARELTEAATAEDRREELGDLLFVLVRLASWLELDPEDALRAANRKFKTRFAAMEEAARTEGKTLDQYGAADLDGLWRIAKAEARGRTPH